MEKINGFDAGMLWNAIVVLIGVFAIIVLFGNVLNTFNNWRRPSKSINDQISKSEMRIKNLEETAKSQGEELALILRSLSVLINHEITGNSIDKLKATQEEIITYLTQR